MPRTGRGGNRQGQPGTQYPNRSDLQNPVPVSVQPGLPYGERQQQQAAQGAIPISAPPNAARSPAPANPGVAAPPPPPTAPGPAPGPGGATGPFPGEMPFDHPTQRPGEPITHGLPRGPGGGPDILSGVGAIANAQTNEQGSLAQFLGSLASTPGASQVTKDLAATAGAV